MGVVYSSGYQLSYEAFHHPIAYSGQFWQLTPWKTPYSGSAASFNQRVDDLRQESPVQSATRHVTEAFEWQGIQFSPGDDVNCMLGTANRDPSVFTDPDRFDLDRANSRRHLGFATGAHACLGSHLAKAEVRIGLEVLLGRLHNMRLERSLTKAPTGYEFRQSRKLTVSWDPRHQ